MENALTKIEPSGASQVDILIQTIAPAIKGGTDPAIVREQIALMKDLLAMKAKESYDQAMLACRKEMKEVFKDSRNESNNSTFAKLEKIDRMAYPVYDRHGFSLSFSQGKSDQPGWTRLICDVSHGGHHEYPWLEGPMDDTGIKGSKNKTGIQGMGSTWSYLQRRLLTMIFNIRIVGEDLDGQREKGQHGPSNKVEPPDPVKDAKARLWKLLEPVRGVDWNTAAGWLREKKIIGANQTVSKLTLPELEETFNRASIQLDQDAGRI